MRLEIKALPSEAFSLNSRCHWSEKRKATQEALLLVREALGAPPWTQYAKAKARVLIVVATRRRRDGDNFSGRLKPFWDALEKWGIIEEDDLEHLRVESLDIEVDPARAPLTVIELDDKGEKWESIQLRQS